MRSLRGMGFLVAILVVVVAVAGACSKSSKNSPTSPGGGTTVSHSLPAGGGSASQTFTTAENIAYKCGIHPSIMHGDSVIVTSASANDSVLVNVVGLTTPGFSPS